MLKRDKKGRFAKGSKPGPGRPKKAKSSSPGKPFEDFIQAYEKLGGIEELVRWANQNNSNKMKFYELLLRIIPKDSIERLLAKKKGEDEMNVIVFMPARAMKRVEQLEAFIKSKGLKVPPWDPPYRRMMTHIMALRPMRSMMMTKPVEKKRINTE